MINLISGKEALIALANGEEVQWMNGERFQDVTDQWQLCEFSHPSFKFRLKPRTITINGIEVPAPFEPKIGEYVYFISSDEVKGYAETTLVDTEMNWGLCNSEHGAPKKKSNKSLLHFAKHSEATMTTKFHIMQVIYQNFPISTYLADRNTFGERKLAIMQARPSQKLKTS